MTKKYNEFEKENEGNCQFGLWLYYNNLPLDRRYFHTSLDSTATFGSLKKWAISTLCYPLYQIGYDSISSVRTEARNLRMQLDQSKSSHVFFFAFARHLYFV